jgi:hypothetical protein
LLLSAARWRRFGDLGELDRGTNICTLAGQGWRFISGALCWCTPTDMLLILILILLLVGGGGGYVGYGHYGAGGGIGIFGLVLIIVVIYYLLRGREI